MSKAPSPLLGYNNNVRHKNRIFHVQTEDSGVKHPHIITHLFMDGGRILKSIKKSYAEHVGTEGMSDVVRNMMKEQHKEMLIALRDGQFDHLVDPKAAAKAAAPAAAPAPAKPSEAVPAKTAQPQQQTPRPPSQRPAAPVVRPASVRPPAAAVARGEDAPATARHGELTLDIDALSRSSESGAAVFEPQNDLPPPPQNLLRDKHVTGSYRQNDPTRPATRPPPPVHRPPTGAPPPRKVGSAGPPTKSESSSPPRQGMPPFAAKPPGKPPASRPGEGRYAPARPAAIFGAPAARPNPTQPSSLFGEDLISDKSLDEVILSYLAEDLEPSDKKKR